MSVPLPDLYAAVLWAPLTLRASVGAAPEYEAGSANFTASTISRPSPYTPFGVSASTSASGRRPRTAMPPLAESEPGLPGSGRRHVISSPSLSATLLVPKRSAVLPA